MKFTKQLIIFLGALGLLSACDKLFVDGVEGMDADLQGKWQQISNKNVYYNFQNNIFEYQEYIQKDTVLTVYGYYTLLGDTAIYLELLPEHTQINIIDSVYPMDYLGWDTIPGINGLDTLTQQFSIKFVTNKEINLTNPSKKYDFRRF